MESQNRGWERGGIEGRTHMQQHLLSVCYVNVLIEKKVVHDK